MSRNGTVAGPDHDPALLEAEVTRLRDECLRVLRELEGRYQHAADAPRRLLAGARRVEERAIGAVRRRPIVAALATGAAIGALALLVWEVRMRRRRLVFWNERQLRRARRSVRGLLPG